MAKEQVLTRICFTDNMMRPRVLIVVLFLILLFFPQLIFAQETGVENHTSLYQNYTVLKDDTLWNLSKKQLKYELMDLPDEEKITIINLIKNIIITLNDIKPGRERLYYIYEGETIKMPGIDLAQQAIESLMNSPGTGFTD